MFSFSLTPAFFRFLRRIFVGVIVSYVLVSLTLGGTPAARPVFFVSTFGCLGWLWLRRNHLAAPPKKLARIGEVVAFNCALTLLLAELSLRTFAICTGHSLMVSDALDAYRLTPGREYGRGLRGNHLGFPGPNFQTAKRPGIFRIAALGDSFSVGPTVPFSDNYLTLLKSSLHSTEVYNFGVSGTGPREYSLILNKNVWTYQPDLVLVSVFVGNDISEIMATPRHMDPRQLSLYLFLTRSARMLVEEWRERETNATRPEETFDRSGWHGQETVPQQDDLEVHHSPLTTHRSPLSAHHSPLTLLSTRTFREIEARRLAVCLKPPPPSLEKKWLRAELYLDRIVTECRKRSVAVAFVLIPDELQVNPNVLEDALEDSGLDRQAIDIRLPQRRLIEFFAELDVPCLDLLPAFAPSEDLYTLHDTHWNVRGNHLAARCISEWLKARVDSRQ